MQDALGGGEHGDLGEVLAHARKALDREEGSHETNGEYKGEKRRQQMGLPKSAVSVRSRCQVQVTVR